MNTIPKKIFLVVFDLGFFFSHRYYLIKELSKHNIEFTIISYFEGSPPDNEQNIQYHFINSSRETFGPFNLILNSIVLSKLILLKDPDLIYAVSHRSIFLARFANLFIGKKSLYAITGMGSMFTKQLSMLTNMYTSVLRFIALKIYKLLIKGQGVYFLLQNNGDQEFLAEQNISNALNSYIIAGNGLEESFFHSPVKVEQEKFQFIMISRILKDKGVIEFLLAAKKVLEIYPESEFILYGAFDLTNPHSISSEELQKYLSPNIIYAGYEKNIKTKILNSSVVVLPSYREGFSRVLMEAQACSKPIITSDISGCRDVIINNKTGYLVQPASTNDLAEKMIAIMGDLDNYSKFSLNAYNHARENFSVDKAVQEHLEVFNRITSK